MTDSPHPATVSPIGIRSGPAHWWRGFVVMVRWQLLSMRLVLPVMIIVQMLIAVGLSVGISMFFSEIDSRTGLYLGTGASIIVLVLVGLVVAPQLIASEKEAGTYDFSWSLPLARSASVAAWLAVSAVVSVPSAAAALVVAGWRLDLTYTFSWTVVPATVLVLVCGTLIGYAVAHAIENTNVTQIVSQILAFGILGFTPITYPPENLPDWLAGIHRALPFFHMGVVVRDGLARSLVPEVAFSYLVLAAWTTAGFALTAWVVGRRG